ncbi:pentapeptide repeat-containing protein [Pelagicoccus sp. SDUM812002]|uniref:pentapeptide repeat-containing protein n=1 Tax=Pelagicoccus sp. SDUM812002 TaxID=3041266 RepID=UPI00280DA5EE|nr:pentapeptide repeat-containing protein [Pelagicoccus sp. SDUM812002]MDQ8184081.1 pentapeptide repeat-containing protein [Pelagicoccus sp. SDUM812002]
MVTGGIAITAIIGLVIAWQANDLLAHQNDTLDAEKVLLETQNERLAIQNQLLSDQNVLAESARRSSLVFELTSILDEIDEELDAANIQVDAVVTRNLGQDAGSGELEGKRPRRRDEEHPPLYRLSDRLTGRIVALSRSLRPYRFLGDDGKLLLSPLSPERGQLLISLVDSGIDMEEINHSAVTFVQSDLRSANLSQYDFTHITLEGSNLSEANLGAAVFHYARMDGAVLDGAKLGSSKLNWSSWKNASFAGAKLQGADLEEIDLENADLSGADLGYIENWQSIRSLKGTRITDVKNPPEGFTEWALQHGAVL